MLQDGNKGLQNELKSVKNENSELEKERSHLEYQLKKMKEELQLLIDRANKKKYSIVREIELLQNQSNTIQMQKDKE